MVLPPLMRAQAQVQEQGTLGKAAAKEGAKHEENYVPPVQGGGLRPGCGWVGYGAGGAGLKTHVGAKHKGAAFKCEDCGKGGFSMEGTLTRHYKNACPRRPDNMIPNPYAVAAVPGAVVVATVIGKES